MQLSSALIFALGLASTTSGYVVTMFKDVNCKGASQRKNVWDNTCSNAGFHPKSVRVEVYGGWNQKVYFYTHSDCIAGTEKRGPWYADHPNNSWKKGGCITMDGYAIKSFGSRA
ncbi:hypothetical protein ColTof4_01351 [Colletotrichum tofieldiae]|nr:hypothetical protein ColTof3_08605 [Colletotrichum tofieldiae]GKT68928.1 hypothetical protein ColTof4_01351 [Colletotrichum tofieldiae]GKT96787.1 hypothetical protein Ct61P_14637 [Colletotrichum tofieldiae]